MGSLVRCEHCGKRVRTNLLKLHHKQCVKLRRALKLEYNKRNTQSLEDRANLLSQYVEDIKPYDLKNITDLKFNFLIDNLKSLDAKKKEKEIELETQRIEAEIAVKAEELKAAELSKKRLETKSIEENNRLDQATLENEKVKDAQIKKDLVQKHVALEIEKANPKEKSIEEKIKSEVETIDKTMKNILPKKKPGRKKKT